MKVTFFQTNEEIASTRLRNLLPFRELRKLGWSEGDDVVVMSKHNWRWGPALRWRFGKVVFDVCDDHFEGPHESHYKEACEKADLVTCNSEAMRFRIFEVTGRGATVIDDPYEHDEKPPGQGEGILWFGHRSNLKDLYDAYKATTWPLRILTNIDQPWAIPWSNHALLEEMERCRAVLIPTGKSPCKSANRAVTAIRLGRYPVCGPLRAYEEIPGIWVGDIAQGLMHAMTEDTTEEIRQAQDYVRERFSPERIGQKWNETLLNLISGAGTNSWKGS